MKTILAAMLLMSGSAMAETYSDGCNTTTCDGDEGCVSTLAYCSGNATTIRAVRMPPSLPTQPTLNFSYRDKPIPLALLPDGSCVVDGKLGSLIDCHVIREALSIGLNKMSANCRK